MYLQPQKPSNVTKPIVKTLNSIKVAFDADPVSLDPHVQLSAGMIQYAHMVFDPLIRWNQQGGFEGRLATKWERIDPLTVRFHLREGVKFHSGNPFTAKDVAWTLARLKKSQDYKALFEAFDAPVIIDDYTIDIKTKKPYALLENMSTYIFPMDSVFYTGKDAKGMDKDTILKTAYSFANENESGTGKYKVTFREQGVKMVFTKFADYWDTTGNVDEIVLTPISNDATRVAALLSGDVDFIMPVPPQDYERVKGNKDL
ncbi:MAG: ABC transporter substrate-binding protein, partial [Desulfoplanes sp.]